MADEIGACLRRAMLRADPKPRKQERGFGQVPPQSSVPVLLGALSPPARLRLLPLLKSVSYQPPPFNRKPAAEINRFSDGLPHLGQSVSSGSLIPAELRGADRSRRSDTRKSAWFSSKSTELDSVAGQPAGSFSTIYKRVLTRSRASLSAHSRFMGRARRLQAEGYRALRFCAMK